MNKTTILIIFSLILTLIVINGQGCQQELQECSKDSDCVKVQITCCPCNSGGIEQCVPRQLEQVYRGKMNKTCPAQDNLMCTALYNCKIESCACVKGKCG